MKTLLIISLIAFIWAMIISMIKISFFDDFLDNEKLKKRIKVLEYDYAELLGHCNFLEKENKILEEKVNNHQ